MKFKKSVALVLSLCMTLQPTTFIFAQPITTSINRDKATINDLLDDAKAKTTFKHGDDSYTLGIENNWITKDDLPNTEVTRGKLAQIALKTLGIATEENKENAYYTNLAKENGIIVGDLSGDLMADAIAKKYESEIVFNNVKTKLNNKYSNTPVAKLETEKFFGLPVTSGYQLSDDGNYLLFSAPYENRSNVYVQKIGEKEPVRVTSSTDRDILGSFWKGNKVIYIKDSGGDENYHLYSVNVDGTNDKELTPFKNTRVMIADTLEDVDNEMLIMMNQKNPEVFDVYKLNVETAEVKLIVENPGNIAGYLPDRDGKIRIAIASDGIDATYLIRKTEEDEFEVFFETKNGDTFNPMMFTMDGKSLFAISNIGRNTMALVKFDLETKKETLISVNEQYDLLYVAFDDESDDIKFIAYYSDKEVLEFYDKKMEATYKQMLVRFKAKDGELNYTSNKDENKFIVTLYSDINPGESFYYDSVTSNTVELGKAYPWIEPSQMSEMTPVSYKARDGQVIHGYLTTPRNMKPENLSVVINPHGGPWARDVWGFNPEVQFLANRGYAVLQMNFRGSTGYGKKFLELGNKQWGKTMQDDITDGVNWLIDTGIANKDKVAIYGASYGGYATLSGVTTTPDLYAAAVDYVGVSNLLTFLETIPPYWESMKKQLHERVGNPATDYDAMFDASPINHVDKIKTPLMVVQGANDPRVNQAESDQIVKALKERGVDVKYILKENEGHGFVLQENRLEFYNAMDEFFAKYLK